MKFQLQLLSLLGVIATVTSSCHRVSRQHMDTDEDHCIHPDMPDYMIPVGKFILTQDCLNLTCTASEVTACQFGWALAPVVGLPEECKKVQEGDCGVRFVQKDDDDKLCFPDKGIEYNSM